MPTPKAYYNEWDAKAAAWLRVLIKEGLIADGDVDTRSILEVRPSDLQGYTQVHFFAGIGGWSLALRLAGWDDSRPVWTGSCPCQPFSLAGRQKGFDDERHLWPEFKRLIGAERPSKLFGEQVATKAGRIWLARVRIDLEELGYGVGAADLCAAGVGAPHIRQRLYWVADSDKTGRGDVAPRTTSAERDGLRAIDMAGGTSVWAREGEPTRFKDGSTRRSKSGVAILVDGFPDRMDICGGFGNAIVPQLAAEFIQASIEAMRC